MTRKEFIEQIEDLVEMDRGTLNESEMLFNVAGWDSLAVMSFIAMVDENLGVALRAPTIADAKSIKDLVTLVAEKLED